MGLRRCRQGVVRRHSLGARPRRLAAAKRKAADARSSTLFDARGVRRDFERVLSKPRQESA
jgi:hypothetical protein